MSRFNPQEDIDDEVIIKNINDWQISVSKSRKRLYINTVSYHPPKLEFSREDLQELIKILDKVIKK